MAPASHLPGQLFRVLGTVWVSAVRMLLARLHPSTVSECIDNNSHGLLVATAAMCLMFLLPLLVRGMQTFASITDVNSQITHSAPHSEPYYRMCTYRLPDGCQRLTRQGVPKRPERSKLWGKNGDVGVSVSTANRAELERLPATEAGF